MLPEVFIDWEPFFKYLNITPEDYKKKFVGYIDSTDDKSYPSLIYHNVDQDSIGNVLSGFNIENLIDDKHVFHMSSDIANKIKETVTKENTTWFFIEINNFENIYFITKKGWFVYNHKSKPTKLENSPPDGEYKNYGVIHDEQVKKANEGDKFYMLEPITNSVDNVIEGIYKNKNTNILYEYKNDIWYPISTNKIDRYNITTGGYFEYPSYPPYGEYIKDDDVKESKKPYNIFIRFVNEQVKLAGEEKEFTMNESVAEKLPNNNQMYYEQVEDKSIILYKSQNEWHDKNSNSKIYIEDDRYINKKYKITSSIKKIDGGSKIRKTIKKKYRKSKFLTRKNKKKYIKKIPNFKKKI
jgi:hypothetical protein